ncbi:phosphoenolpyruvate carboxylase [Acetobacter tropicalis]|uniref:Phosphoenolpyruvate carboxylase n=1 Tax=Acetobacter tropicalis NBRC 101654 TaxID=749388 RepID=F7VD22_9PROT|nr:phosphoenolpyruvate carboxylase [Acetobacter tropicalis]GAA08267.1 phosphoenolpyruvate carboxylase [Acetobacter tropicalis NBRC 101654]
MDYSTFPPALASLLTTIRNDAEDASNPVMAMAHMVGMALEDGRLAHDDIAELVRTLRDAAFLRRAGRLHRYVGGAGQEATHQRLKDCVDTLLTNLPTNTPEAFTQAVSPTRFAAVFTAHPTFAVNNDVYAALAQCASQPVLPDKAPYFETHRRSAPPTLNEEFDLATQAIARARDAIDLLSAELLSAAQQRWPESWHTLAPQPIIATSWVGYDTDGRTDIGWWDTLRLRLRMKLFQLERLEQQINASGASVPILQDRLKHAISTVKQQIEATPTCPDPQAVARFADLLVNHHATALRSASELATDLQDAIAAAEPQAQLPLAVARAGFLAHGLALAHTHVRLNATQIHNFVRQKLNLRDDPGNPAHRRALLNRVNEALTQVTPVAVDFGALLSDPATAGRLMMTIAQIIKHIDADTPVRFLIAETETGYTLLAALWAATYFGVADKIEISPLFETEDALANGERIVEEVLRSPSWRDYIRRTGRMCFQFGYSDSGRYIGQLAATNLIERLRLKIHEQLVLWDLTDITVVFFDTHGESIGRGAHPFRMADRLHYLSPPFVREKFSETGIVCREETAFQGGDGYLLFGTPELAGATIASIAENLFTPFSSASDPVYEQPDFSADFFSSISEGMTTLVGDPGYAALLGAFGPALIDRTGSRPPARQSAEAATGSRLTHPSQLRAIPNNAILQQLGWCANTLQGLGSAARRHPDTFETFNTSSPRFHRALDFAQHALASSDDRVLKCVIQLLDPGFWLDRATAEPSKTRRAAFLSLMRDLEKLDFSADLQAMFRRIQADHLALREAWEDAPHGSDRLRVLHAVRIALIERIWLLACRIPFFMPRSGFNRDVMMQQILCLEIPAVLKEMDHIFPSGTAASDLDFHEPRGPREESIYINEHRDIFIPMRQIFELVREISVAVMHDIGAFG